MFVSCPSCRQQVAFSDAMPLRARCACSYPWTAEDTALATNHPVPAVVPAKPVVRAEPVVRNGLVYEDGITYHVPPPPIIEAYRDQRSWSYIVRAVDDLVAALTELEDQIGQKAYGIYDWQNDRFNDVGNLSDISKQAVAAFVVQFRNLPRDRQAILQPYLTWALSVVKRCADDMEPRVAAARAASPELREHQRQMHADAIDAANAERQEAAEQRETSSSSSSGWGLLGAVVAYQIGKYRGRRGY